MIVLRARGEVAMPRQRVRRYQLELPRADWLVVLNRCRLTEVLRAREDALQQLLGLLRRIFAIRERTLRVDGLDAAGDEDDRVRVDPHVCQNVGGVPELVVLPQLEPRYGGPHDALEGRTRPTTHTLLSTTKETTKLLFAKFHPKPLLPPHNIT